MSDAEKAMESDGVRRQIVSLLTMPPIRTEGFTCVCVIGYALTMEEVRNVEIQELFRIWSLSGGIEW